MVDWYEGHRSPAVGFDIVQDRLDCRVSWGCCCHCITLYNDTIEKAITQRASVTRHKELAPGQLHCLEASGLDFADAASLAVPRAPLRQQGRLANSFVGNWWFKAQYPNAHFADVAIWL